MVNIEQLIRDLSDYLDIHKPAGLDKETQIRLAHEGSQHLIFETNQSGGMKPLIIRVIHPDRKHHKGAFIGIEEEYAVATALQETEVVPELLYFADDFPYPFMVEEYVSGQPLSKFAKLDGRQLVGAAQAIARIQAAGIKPTNLPLLRKYTKRGFDRYFLRWGKRIWEASWQDPRPDNLEWIAKIVALIPRVALKLRGGKRTMKTLPYSFHLDGAHAGNLFWDNGRVIIIDLDKVSWRRDQTFTLVRFASSLGEHGQVDKDDLELLVWEYLTCLETPFTTTFLKLAQARLLERQMSDLVYTLWQNARARDPKPLAQTAVPGRYQIIRESL